jgi:Skp family chaperone for outer membrane proteins
MKAWKLASLVGALVAVGMATTALPGNAQKKDRDKDRSAAAADAGVGYVDLNKIMDQVKKTSTWVTMTKSFDDARAKYQGEIASLTKIRYLTATEKAELDQIRAKTSVTAGEKARIAELEGKSEALDKEAQTLAGVEKPTAEQSKRIEELSKLRQAAIANLQDETEKRSEQLRKLEEQVLDDMQAKILEQVKKVAESRNLGLVVDQRAVLFGGQDLTDDIMKKLDAGKK